MTPTPDTIGPPRTAHHAPPWIRRVGDGIAWTSTRIAAIALVAIVAINGCNVFGRYFLSSPISWAEEAMLYLMVLVVFSALATVTWSNAHIRIELMLDHVPARMRWLLTSLATAVTIGICLVVAWESFAVVAMLHSFDQRSEAMEFPIWIPQACVGLGLTLTAALTALRLFVSADEPASSVSM